MKTTAFDQLKATLQLLVVATGYFFFGIVLLGLAEGLWRIPAALVMAFLLPVLVSSVMRFYWQLCRPMWQRLSSRI